MAFDLKSIKSLFVIEDENAAPKKASPAKKGKAASAPVKKAVTGTASTAAQPGKASAKFTDILFGALEKNNLPGVDYLEYKQSLQSLEKMPMEEKVRYQSAFAMAQAMGATPAKLIETAAHYMDVLKGEEAKFAQALANQEASKIQGRKQQIDQLNATIQQKAAQVKKLTEEMQLHSKDMEKLKEEISKASVSMETTKNNFKASYQLLITQIQKDVENMKQFLK